MLKMCLLTIVPVLLLAGAAAAQTAPPRTDTASAKAGTVVNLNTATAADLEKLPGIGAKTAQRILEYRQKNGPFKKIEELMNVQGIGEKSFLKLRPQLAVGGGSPSAGTPQ
ncbi:MAG: ComEA family DNA-binding protein [Vicinamibacterales bacterium]